MERCKYKGLSPGLKRKIDGIIPWKVYVYNKRTKKTVFYGSYDTMIEAVEARRKVVGSIEFALWFEKSRTTQEIAEEPDQEAVEAFRQSKTKTHAGWECKGCAQDYDEKPGICPKCFSIDFDRLMIPTESYRTAEV